MSASTMTTPPSTDASSTDVLTMLETQEQELVTVHEEYCALIERLPNGWHRQMLQHTSGLVSQRLNLVRATIRGLRAAARLEVA